MNMDYFGYLDGLAMTNDRFAGAVRRPGRGSPESPITQREMDLAQSIQDVTEEIVLKLARHAREITGKRNLCLAGGVALNCVANGVLLREGIFDDLWIQPAAGDAGGALGAPLAVWHNAHGQAADGRALGRGQAAGRHARLAARPRVHARADPGVPRRPRLPVRRALRRRLGAADRRGDRRGERHRPLPGADGVRARGRSAAARSSATRASPRMQSVMNLKIKFRESFRPFAPSVLEERVSRLLRARPAEPLHAAGGRRGREPARSEAGGRAQPAADRVGEPAALGRPGHHPRRLLGAHPDGAARRARATTPSSRSSRSSPAAG